MITNLNDFKKLNENNETVVQLTAKQIVDLVKEAFDDNVFASVGDHFGSPSAHLEGKENFIKALESKLNINLPKTAYTPEYNTDDELSIDVTKLLVSYYGKDANDPNAYSAFLKSLERFNKIYELELIAPSQDQLHKGFDSILDNEGEIEVFTKDELVSQWNKALKETSY